jgi:uncharacterized membrane protein YbhN (UPF0104 family)
MSALSSRRRRITVSGAPRVRGDRPAVIGERLEDRPERPLVDPDLPEQSRAVRPRVGRRLVTLGLVLVFAVALLASVPGLRGVLDRIERVNPAWIMAAVALEVASEVSFVAVFRLFFDRLPGRDARRLAWTELASGALLPVGGAGGLAIGAWLMSLTGAHPRWIARRSAGLFLLGGGVSSAALVGAGVALIAGVPGPHDFLRAVLPTAIAAPGTLAIAALPWILRSRPRAPRWLSAISTGVKEAEQTTFSRRSGWRPVAALGYLGFDMAVLWVALNALGHPPSIPALTMAYSIGYAANSLPIPGGIGVLDAGLTGALVLYGVSPATAGAAVLIYHAIALWIPGLGGLYAYLRLRPRLLGPGNADTNAASLISPAHSCPQGCTP